MWQTKGYAAMQVNAQLEPFLFERREPGTEDIVVEILYCGICHSDLHAVEGMLPIAVFPLVPGHEIIGKVSRIGDSVSTHKIGDIVGIGSYVDSCRHCPSCTHDAENFCPEMRGTFGSFEADGVTPTYGGYSNQIVIAENYALKVSDKLSPAGAAPLLCAGITTYSPLKHWKVGKGSKVAIVGLGGLGHMAVKLASTMGAEVTVLSRTEAKREDAIRLGATHYAATEDPQTFPKLAGQFDLILNTVSASINYDAYIMTLANDGTFVQLGVTDEPISVNTFSLLMGRKSIAGSIIGGLAETQEMLDFCAEHSIESDIEVIPMQQVNQAYKRIHKSDVRYRFVLDMASLR